MPNKLRNSIAYRLLLVVLLFSLAITLLSAGVRLYFDYRDEMSSLEKDFGEIEKVELKGMAESLWLMDTEHLHAHLQGFLNIGHIRYAKIQYKEQLIVSAGTPQTEQVVHRQFPLYYTYNNRPLYIGTLFVSASLKEVYAGLLGNMAGRLLYQGIQVFLITLFMFVIFQVFVTRHLITMAAYFRKAAPWEFDKPLVLAGYTSADAEKDEIGQVATAINTMGTNMRNAFHELEAELQKRRRAEESLLLFRELIDQSNDAIFVIDPETGRFLDVNEMACGSLGYTRDELLSMGVADVAAVIPDDFSWKAHVAEVNNRGYMVLEDRHKRKDGTTFPVEVNVKYIAVEKGDYMLAVSRDITERKRAEEALRENQARLDLALRSARMGVWHWDIIENKRYFDDQICHLLGINPAMFTGTAEEFFGAVHPDDRETIKAALARTIEQDVLYEPGYRAVWPDGSVHYITARGRLVRDDKGRPVRINGIIWDITERKRMEEELRKLNEELEGRVVERTADLQKKSIELLESQRALMNIVEDLNLKTNELEKANTKLRELDKLKSMFIASMSHELRTPLNSIIGFSSILHGEWLGPLTAEQKENLSIILRSGKHLLSLINDVIDVSKVEAGIIERHVEDFDIFDVISEAVTTFTKDIEEKGLELRVEAVHEHMHTDRRRLLQCVLNLISNAVKFTEKGSITVQTLIREPERADAGNGERMVEISVSDTGIGIREENMPKLCNAFVRLESPLEARVPGTGLGLYLTKKLLAEVLKGEIICISRYAEGSRFAMKVPVRIE